MFYEKDIFTKKVGFDYIGVAELNQWQDKFGICLYNKAILISYNYYTKKCIIVIVASVLAINCKATKS